ncbi:InlB B-repeat-containing protein [Lysinibacillus sp. FSL M8-0337]|uniref:InlB B-repeat-containing protein n=1 Tax=Lysinibacillus sp. FSL M8-0337 TaxID=2921718 RepID=UPI003159F107
MKKIINICIILLLLGLPWGNIPADANGTNESDFVVTPIGTGVMITGYIGKEKDLVIPETLNGLLVTAIGFEAFSNKQLTSVTIPSSVMSIRESAFRENQLTNVTIPSGVTSIGKSAFLENQLTSVTIPSSVASIGSHAFYRNQLTSVTIPSSVTSIERHAFSHNQLTSVTIPSSVTSIDDFAFYTNQLTSVTIPNSVTSIGHSAFGTNDLTSVTIPSSVTSMEAFAFHYNQLNQVEFEGQTKVNSLSFANQVRNGKGHLGWYEDSLYSISWTGNVLGPMIIYAKWEAVQYELTFDTNGGSIVPSQMVDEDAKATPPSAPTKTGYTFGGWYKEATLTNQWDFTTDVVTKDTTLYAKWNVAQVVQNELAFNTDGGTAVPSQRIVHNTKGIEPPAPTKTGYTFGGWYKEATLTNQWDFTTDVVTKDTTLYAKWNVAQVVQNELAFNTDGGTAVPSQRIVHNTKGIEPPAPTKTGYTFGGWYKEATLTNQWDFTTDVVTKDTTLYAKWNVAQVVQNELAFNTDGGTAVPSQLIVHNTKGIEPPAPTKAGYTFGGWYKEATLTNQWDFAKEVIMGHTTLYAKWVKNSSSENNGGSYVPTSPSNLNVFFETNDGDSLDSLSVAYDKKITELPIPTKKGFTFGGWYKEAALINQWDLTTDSVTKNTKLYAKWIANKTPEWKPDPAPEEPKPERPMVTFNDISDHWAKEMIEEVAGRGIIKGYPDGSFRPNEFIQRQHVALLFHRAFEFKPKRKVTTFSDVGPNHPYYEAVMSLQQAGIIDGSDGKFHPTALLTRAQMAKIVVLTLEIEPGGMSTFQDVSTTHWSYAYIAALAEREIVLGDNGKFKPDQPVTRAQFVAIMYRALNLK